LTLLALVVGIQHVALFTSEAGRRAYQETRHETGVTAPVSAAVWQPVNPARGLADW